MLYVICNNICIRNALNAILFMLQVILHIMKVIETSESSYYSLMGIDDQLTHHVVAMEKVAQ